MDKKTADCIMSWVQLGVGLLTVVGIIVLDCVTERMTDAVYHKTEAGGKQKSRAGRSARKNRSRG